MGRKSTIHDVANLAGVSIATVDRVLNRRGGVTPEKERRVFSAARRLKIDRNLERGYAHRLRVAVVIQSTTNPFHAALSSAFAVANRTYSDLKMQFLVHHLDPKAPEGTAALIDRLGRQHDGLIVTSPAEPAIVAQLRHVATSIPVVTLATDVPDCGRHVYVGPDDLQGGRVAGELMGRFLGAQGGEVLVIVGLLSLTGHKAREDGFRTVLARHFPACRVIAVEESCEDASRAVTIASAALRDCPQLRGLYLATAGADGVVRAFRDVGRTDLVFITHELTQEKQDLLKRREIHAVVDQDASGEVQVVTETMGRLLGRIDGDPVSCFTPVRIYTPENWCPA